MKGYDGRTGIKESKGKTSRRRSEAILVKVEQDANWIDQYRVVVRAKSALKEMTEVRKTMTSHILIELTNKIAAGEIAGNLKKVMRQVHQKAEVRYLRESEQEQPETRKQISLACLAVKDRRRGNVDTLR